MSLFDEMKSETEERIAGVVLGIVTGLEDSEHIGMVKIKFPLRECEDEGYWARVASLFAGSFRGTYFLPEVGDEVLIAFEDGYIDKPFVIGSLWNGKDKPPADGSDGKNNIKTIKSRSGHEIIFNDNSEEKKEKIEIRTKAGHSIVLDDSDGKEKIEVKDKTGSNSIVINSAEKSIEITSQMSLKIKSQKIEIESDTTMTIKAGAKLDIQGAIVKIN